MSKKILTGSILTVSPQELLKFVAIYSAIGFLHFLARRPLLALSENASPLHRGALSVLFWDLFLYLLRCSRHQLGWNGRRAFGLLFPYRTGRHRLAFFEACGDGSGHCLGRGHSASAACLAASFMLDLPAGAAMVAAFGVSLIVACLAEGAVFCGRSGAQE